MKKIIFPLSFVFILFLGNIVGHDFKPAFASENPYVNDFTYVDKGDGNYLVSSVDNDSVLKENLRIYSIYEGSPVNEIAADCFANCDNLTSIMIGNGVTIIPQGTLDILSLNQIHYTGSLQEWNGIGYLTDVVVYEYAFDEGFINYWNKFVRPEEDSSVCDIGENNYKVLKEKYNNLTPYDKSVVNDYTDKGGETIGSSMKYLDAYFTPKENKESRTEIDKTTTLSIIVGIAIFGMTSIAVFYLLMKKNIIS